MRFIRISPNPWQAEGPKTNYFGKDPRRMVGEVKEMARDGVLTPCPNPSHQATIAAVR